METRPNKQKNLLETFIDYKTVAEVGAFIATAALGYASIAGVLMLSLPFNKVVKDALSKKPKQAK